MIDDKELKKIMISEFRKNYEKYYPVKILESFGFKRYICKKCGKGFWSIRPRDVCNEPECDDGYTFISKKVIKEVNYKQTYELFSNFMKKFGYKKIKRYPVVARWYDQLYFVSAGINDFQPYVVSGEVAPPAQATTEDQFCLRFNDIENVGITGRHYTGFIMIGQHVFNYPEKYLYFKNEAVQQLLEFFLNKLKLKKEDLILHEDVWAGGGNFGPSIEFFTHGLELANQVYMQYEQLPDGSYRELKTKVVDMGAGAERWAWLGMKTFTSYEAVFPKVLNYLKNSSGFSPDKRIWEKFGKYAGILNIDEVENVEEIWNKIAKKVGVNINELRKEIFKSSALYSIADHTRSLLVAIHDGELPSNVGGGYNLRNILRRCFYFVNKYGWRIDLERVFELQMKEFGEWYGLKDTNLNTLFEIIDIEKKKYEKTLKNAKSIIKKLNKKVEVEELLKLYESNGITPEIISQINPEIKIPRNFYSELEKIKTKKKKKEEIKIDVSNFKKTILGFREDEHKFEFTARVLGQVDKFLILDVTYFYPKMGGQDFDLGEINGNKIEGVFMKNGVVLHELLNDVKFKVGEEVKCKIDKKRRIQLTKTHSAVHVVGYAARKLLGSHINQAGSEKTIEKGKIDLTHYKSISFEELQKIEKLANEVVFKGIKVEKFVLPRNIAEEKYGMRIYQGGAVPGKELRIVKIGNLDVQACGGTHVDNTSEIGFIKLISAEKVKDGVVRIEMKVDENAIKEIQKNERILKSLSELWNVPYEDLPKTAERFFEEWKKFKKEAKEFREKYSKKLIENELKKGEKIVKVKVPIEDFGILMGLVKDFDLKNKVLILIGSNFAYGVSNTDVNVKAELEKICENVQGNEKEAKGFKLKS